jgi:cell wall-associated NlpC family hydrolase
MAFAYPAAVRRAAAQLGAPYQLGAKWAALDPAPAGPVDCSGFSKWLLSFAGVTLPDGSFNQIKVCSKLPASLQQLPPALALGFFDPQGDPDLVDHVIVSMGAGVVIEARGAPYNCVICRPAAAWLAQIGFLGFYAPPGLTMVDPGAP